MSFVFLSHADPDKPRVKHVVKALIAAGHKVWLDNPPGLGFTKDEIEKEHILDNFIRLHAGGAYRDEIDEALQKSSVVLVCWSELAKTDRKVWHSEATYARIEKKLVACRVDDVNPKTLPDEHDRQQVVDLRPEIADQSGGKDLLAINTRQILDDIKGVITRRATKTLDKRAPRDPFAPFLIDRTDQESPVGGAIEDITSEGGGVRAFIVSGPENECPEEFMMRLRNYTSRRLLKDGAWSEVHVEWPFERSAEEFPTEYRRRLGQQIDSRASIPDIAEKLGGFGRAVAVISLIAAEEWMPDERERIEAWLSLWQQIAESSARFSAVPILLVKMGVAEPGWEGCPSGRCPNGKVDYAEIWREAKGIEESQSKKPRFAFFGSKEAPKRAPFAAVPLLHPIRRPHVDRWLASPLLSEMQIERRTLLDRIETIFARGPAQKNGVSLKAFADEMRPLFGETP